MNLRIMVSRHSAFYSPLISTIAAGFLERQGHTAEYGILAPGQRSSTLIRERTVDIMQSAVSSNWKPMEQGESPLPVHFAAINQRDGFFLVTREPKPAFDWKKLEGRRLLADRGLQPFTMLKYAARYNGVDWERVQVVEADADYVHRQAPGAGDIVASVGESMPPVAFSSLCCSREFLKTDACRSFLEAFKQAREWVRAAPAEEVARKEAAFFPGVAEEALAAAIGRYQRVGCWDGGAEITRELYEQALNVFESEGEITRRHLYEEVCQT